MTADLGALLRQWRGTRQMSMELTARQVGVTRMTLHRWESGQFWPRLQEMEALLDTLETTPQQRRQALDLLSAPRAVVRLRQEVAQEAQKTSNGKTSASSFAATLPLTVSATVSGGLLHALRLRRGMTLEDTARCVGVHKSTLSRWERGDTLPPPEHLHTLCYLLGASVPELVAMAARRPEPPPLSEEAATEEELHRELRRVCVLAPHDPEESLKDLLFLRLEARVWSLPDSAASASMLCDVRAAYASFLAARGRYKDASIRSGWVLEQVRSGGSVGAASKSVYKDSRDATWWMYAALAQAHCAVFQGKRPTPERGLELLRAYLPRLNRPDLAAWALQDMSRYALLAGDTDSALRLSTQACKVVETEGPSNEVFVRQCSRASLLLSAGLPQQALNAVPSTVDHTLNHRVERAGGDGSARSVSVEAYPSHRISMALLRVEALHKLQDKPAAHDWLQRAYSVLETGHLNARLQTKYRAQADKWAQQL